MQDNILYERSITTPFKKQNKSFQKQFVFLYQEQCQNDAGNFMVVFYNTQNNLTLT